MGFKNCTEGEHDFQNPIRKELQYDQFETKETCIKCGLTLKQTYDPMGCGLYNINMYYGENND